MNTADWSIALARDLAPGDILRDGDGEAVVQSIARNGDLISGRNLKTAMALELRISGHDQPFIMHPRHQLYRRPRA